MNAPEPIVFTIDSDRNFHFAYECQPLRTVIDSEAVRDAPWVCMDDTGVVTITLDGKTIIYDRSGSDLHGNWVCDLRVGAKRGIEG
jgi:hypothetical protein